MKNTIIVRDVMQINYEYDLTEKAGYNFDPRFLPELTPKQMLELGVFGGVYMRDCTDEFPKDWFLNAKFSPGSRSAEFNHFGVLAGMS